MLENINEEALSAYSSSLLKSSKAIWNLANTKMLIDKRIAKEDMFCVRTNINKAWEALLSDLKSNCTGFEDITLTQIKKKWANICSKYKVIKDNKHDQTTDWPYFDQINCYFTNKSIKIKLQAATEQKNKHDELYKIKLHNCRLCQEMESVHILTDEPTLSLKIEECTSLKVLEYAEKLPCGICAQCKYLIVTFHKFLLQFREVDKRLRDCINIKPENTIKRENDVKIIEKYKCIECEQQLKSAEELSEHMNTHSKKIQFQCDSCKESFPKLVECHEHMKTHVKENEKIVDKKEDDIDIEEDSSVNNYDHYEIEEIDITKPNLENQETPPQTINENLESKEKKGKLHKCDRCSKSFVRLCDLHVHLDKHNGIKHKCPREGCGKTYTQISSLKMHERKHLGLNSFLCVACGKAFVSKGTLKNHEKTHVDVKAHICNICSIAFAVASSLRQHQKKHHLGHKFYCSQCPKVFLSKSTLDRHEIVHSGIRDFKCERANCPRAFYTKKELIKHERYHQGLRMHHCSYCFKTFYEKHHLTIHIRSHTGERPYPCTFTNCGKAFRCSQKLARHTKRQHKDEKEENLIAI